MPFPGSPLIAEIRALPRAVHVLVGGQFINRFGSFVLPFLALFLTGRGIDFAHVALVLATMSIGGLFGPFASGYLADAIGRRNTIFLSLVSSAGCVIGLYACQTLPQFLAVGVFYGFCTQLYGPAANALLTDLVTPAQRVMAFATMRLAINAGFAAGPAVAGILFSRAPAMVFFGDAATTLIFAALAIRYLPHGLRTVHGRVSSSRVIWSSWREALRDMRRNAPFLQYILAALLMAIAFAQAFNVLALTTADRGLTPAEYGVIMGLNGALIMGFELPLNQWSRRFDPRRVLVVGFILVGVGCASFGSMSTQLGFFAAMALYTLGEMLSLPVGMNYASLLAPEAYRGRYFGVIGMMWSTATLVASSGVWFYGRFGERWWWLAGSVGVGGGLIMLIRPKTVPDTTSQA
mgnify:CR=1 FL=1